MRVSAKHGLAPSCSILMMLLVGCTRAPEPTQEQTSTPESSPAPDAEPAEGLEPSSGSVILRMDSNGMGEHTFKFDKGKVDRVSMKPQLDGFSLESSPQQVKLVARSVLAPQFDRLVPLSPQHDFEIEVTARGDKKGAKFKVLGIREKKTEGITFTDLKEDKIEAVIPEKQMGPLQIEVKIMTGSAENVVIGDGLVPKGAIGGGQIAAKGVTASLANSKIVAVRVAPDAVSGSYEIWVEGKDAKGKADSKARFTLVLKHAPIVLEDLKEGKLEAMIPDQGAQPLKLQAKIVSGEAQMVIIGDRERPTGLKAQLSTEKTAVEITVSPEAAPRTYDIWVMGLPPSKGPANKTNLTLVLGAKVDPNGPIRLEYFKNGEIIATVPGKGAEPLKLQAKIVSGSAQSVAIGKNETPPKGLKAEFTQDKTAVVITVSPEAVARSYEVSVMGLSGDGVASKARLTLVLK